jgi:dienelactone hydrolase
MKRTWVMAAALAVLGTELQAKVITESVEYKHGDVELVGYLAYDNAVEAKRPGVLVVHEWWGLNDYAKKRTEMLAEMGYVAFAVDMYGKGVTAKNRDEAAGLCTPVASDTALTRDRAQAGLEVLLKNPHVDPKRVAAIGYCFGGSTVAQLAYSGADLAGVVSFHGSVQPPADADMKNIKARILICHGADDPMIPSDQILAVEAGLRKAGADWQLISYGRTVHSFTNPAADKAGIDGVKYNPDSDRRSWAAMKAFFDEIFRAEKS